MLEESTDVMADPVVHEACATTITKHCDDVQHGHGNSKSLTLLFWFVQQLYDFKQFHWFTNYVILEYTYTDDVRRQRLTTCISEEIYLR